MSRERLYKNNAARQAAYRARHPEKRLPREDLLAGLARSLHFTLKEAAELNRCPVPKEVLGGRADETLKNLIRYFDPDPDRDPCARKEGTQTA